MEALVEAWVDVDVGVEEVVDAAEAGVGVVEVVGGDSAESRVE